MTQPERARRPAAGSLGAALLRPVRDHHAFEACVEQLATAIRLGGYRNGVALPPERELAERLGVSRATLREAIAALRQAGLVETRRGRGGGTVVSHAPEQPGDAGRSARALPRTEMLDALDFRRIVEPGAAYQAAARVEAGAADDVVLTELREAAQQVADADDPGAHRQADSRFHLAIARTSGSRLLLDSVTVAQARLHEMLLAIPVLGVNIDHSDAQHHAVVTAILGGAPARARRVMEEHCDDTAALLRGLIG